MEHPKNERYTGEKRREVPERVTCDDDGSYWIKKPGQWSARVSRQLSCPICNSLDFVDLFAVDDVTRFQCLGCGALFAGAAHCDPDGTLIYVAIPEHAISADLWTQKPATRE
ncbi:hypothetical protein ASZ90_011222 [hydrocarbon metagenome]|uniref:Uncharacterized protein n=1 Tax=hydrocarbon metagenome TaxID=938273 RepID=A0A0W8FDT5_9ZZZZ|nr:hypothetical protein [Methanomicrobiaceae archaeon]